MKVTTTPRTYIDAFIATDELDFSAFFTNEKAFKATTGSTHGIRLRIRPPKKANNKAVKRFN